LQRGPEREHRGGSRNPLHRPGRRLGRQPHRGNEANYSREFAARTKLRWTPSDATNVVFALETIDAYFNTPYRLMPNSTALDGLTAPADFYDARTTFSPGMDSEQRIASVAIDHDFSWGTLRSVT